MPTLASKLNPRSEEFKANAAAMRDHAEGQGERRNNPAACAALQSILAQ